MRRAVLLFLLALTLSGGALWAFRHDLVAGREASDGMSSFERAKAERLLSDRLPCLGCHAIEGNGGHLGPDLAEVGGRLTQQEILRQIADPQGLRPGSLMPRVSMPSLWRDLIVRYLAQRGRDPTPPDVNEPMTPGLGDSPRRVPGVSDGALAYARFCVACHGESGGGDGPNASFLPVAPAKHSDSASMSRRTDDTLFDTIYRGGYIMNRHPFMPPYGETLSSDDIRALVRYIRMLCACAGPSWSADGEGAAL